MSGRMLFLLDRLDEDADIERSVSRAVESGRGTPGGEPIAPIELRLREWAAVEARTKSEWRSLVTDFVRAHATVLDNLTPARVGVADPPRITYEAYALALRRIAHGYAAHQDYCEEWRA